MLNIINYNLNNDKYHLNSSYIACYMIRIIMYCINLKSPENSKMTDHKKIDWPNPKYVYVYDMHILYNI